MSSAVSPDSLERTIVKKAIKADHAKKLQALIVIFQYAFRDHDDRLRLLQRPILMPFCHVMILLLWDQFLPNQI
jgi:hypothetical protein